MLTFIKTGFKKIVNRITQSINKNKLEENAKQRKTIIISIQYIPNLTEGM